METLLAAGILALGGVAAGILIGRYYVPDSREQKRQARHARIYLRAMNAILARDSQTAIDELVAAVKENVADIEPYFAIGALFRNRGETERAIRVHQAIEMRHPKTKSIRRRARFELGLDFRAAGMPRRAIQAFEDTIAEDDRHITALRALAGVYEHERRYADAAETWRRIVKITGEEAPREPHLLAAAASDAAADGDDGQAKRLIRDAHKLAPQSPHVLATWAEISLRRGDARDAAKRLREAIAARPAMAQALAPALVAAHRAHVADNTRGGGNPRDLSAGEVPEKLAAAARAAAIATLREIDKPGPYIAFAIAELCAESEPERAITELTAIAERHPHFLPARILASRLALAAGDSSAIRQQLEQLAGSDGLAAREVSGWRCSACHARAKMLAWRCERCRRWDVARPAAATPDKPATRDRRQTARALEPGPMRLAAAAEESAADGASPSFWNRASARARQAVASLRTRGALAEPSDEAGENAPQESQR